MSRARVALGILGEDLACQELERRGYAILARRYRRRGGEIDIIARDGDTTVFVEVKTRHGEQCGTSAESVTWNKRRRIVGCASDYLARNRLMCRPCRFDVVSVDLTASHTRIIVYCNAFDAAL